MFAKVGQHILNIDQITSMEIIEGDEKEVRLAITLPGAQPGDYLSLKGEEAEQFLSKLAPEDLGSRSLVRYYGLGN